VAAMNTREMHRHDVLVCRAVDWSGCFSAGCVTPPLQQLEEIRIYSRSHKLHWNAAPSRV